VPLQTYGTASYLGGQLSILEELSDGGPDEAGGAGAKRMPARTLTRALLILQIVALHEEEPVSLARIARQSGLPKPTVHRLAGVLRDSGMLQRDEEGCYLPGPMLLVMGTNYLRKMRLREASRLALMRLHRITSQAVYLGVPQSPWVVNVARIGSTDATDHVGSLNPQHTTAGGKVLLAFGDSDSVRRMRSTDLVSKTSRSITDFDALMRELATVFERGFAVEMGENEEGVVSIAAPVFNQSRRAIGAIGISAPETQVTKASLRNWATEVKASAVRVSNELGWSGVASGILGTRRVNGTQQEMGIS